MVTRVSEHSSCFLLSVSVGAAIVDARNVLAIGVEATVIGAIANHATVVLTHFVGLRIRCMSFNTNKTTY